MKKSRKIYAALLYVVIAASLAIVVASELMMVKTLHIIFWSDTN